MNRSGIGEREFIKFSKSILHRPAVKVDQDGAFLQIDLRDPPDVAVEHLFLVVVNVLQHFVARRIGPAKALELWGSRGIEPLLEGGIQRSGSYNTAIGRR